MSSLLWHWHWQQQKRSLEMLQSGFLTSLCHSHRKHNIPLHTAAMPFTKMKSKVWCLRPPAPRSANAGSMGHWFFFSEKKIGVDAHYFNGSFTTGAIYRNISLTSSLAATNRTSLTRAMPAADAPSTAVLYDESVWPLSFLIVSCFTSKMLCKTFFTVLALLVYSKVPNKRRVPKERRISTHKISKKLE